MEKKESLNVYERKSRKKQQKETERKTGIFYIEMKQNISYRRSGGNNVKNMEKNIEKERLEQQKNHNEFNSITQKVKPENQNQEHNVRKEGINLINQKR